MTFAGNKFRLAALFLALLVILPFFFVPGVVFTTVHTPSGPKGPGPVTIGQRFAGEEFQYKISFWFFDEVAVGSFKLVSDGDGFYTATLTAATTGVTGWLLDRSDVYTSRLQEIYNGKRFRSLSFEKDVTIGSRHRLTTTWQDYDQGLMTWEKWKDGKLRKTGKLKISPAKTYDCALAAFYNFRYGAYGPVGEGREYWISTLPKDETKEIDIYMRVVTREELVERRTLKDPASYFLADVKLDKELFDSKSGKIEILFNDEMVPVEGLAKDIMLFGDVRGRLVGAF